MSADFFAGFDVSFWKTKDKVWVGEREQAWQQVELLLYGLSLPKKYKAISKRYFMKGVLPDWQKHKDDEESPLNLFLFLHLHPSRNEQVLRALRDMYLSEKCIKARDVLQGMGNLSTIGTLISAAGGFVVATEDALAKELPHLSNELESFPPVGSKPPFIIYKKLVLHTQGNNEKLFSLLWPEPSQRTLKLAGQSNEIALPSLSHDLLWTLSRWLTLPLPLNLGSQDMLFQYELPRESWYTQAATEEIPSAPQFAELVLVALYRIYNFNQAAEGHTPRTHFVQKMIEMFDTREFAPSFKEAWAHVKEGGLQVKDPWSNDYFLEGSSLLDNIRSSA